MYIGANIENRDRIVLHYDPKNPKCFTGGNITDLSLDGNDGTNVSSVGLVDSSFSLNGSNYIRSNNAFAGGLFAETGNPFTISEWFKGTVGAITGRGGGTGSSATWVSWIDTNGTRLQIRVRGALTIQVDFLNPDLWNNLTFVWDETDFKCYLNGDYKFNCNVGAVGLQTNDFCVGATASGLNTRFNGIIGDIKVWEIGLTDDEVKRHYKATKERYQ